MLSRRKGEMMNMAPADGGGDVQMTNIEYVVPTRGMIGLRNGLLTATRGTAVIDTIFNSYKPFAGESEDTSILLPMAKTPGRGSIQCLVTVESSIVVFP